MVKYRKKPVVIDAIQWNGNKDMLPEIKTFIGYFQYANGNLIIQTLEGNMQASPGDYYIIKGVNGEFYPCKPDIFEKTYEPVIG